MQDCYPHCDLDARGVLTIRWCPEHHHWVVFAWARASGDLPYVEVHPMWQEPRVIPDDEYANGTLQQLLTATQRVARRLADEHRSGQMTLW